MKELLDKAEREFEELWIEFANTFGLQNVSNVQFKDLLRTSISESVKAALESVRLEEIKSEDVPFPFDNIKTATDEELTEEIRSTSKAMGYNQAKADLDEKINNLIKE